MNMKKRILSFLLAIVMILTVVPALSVSAAEPVDLIHNEDGSIKEGVFVTNFGGQYADSMALWKVINNDTSDTWGSAWTPGDYAWVQVNLPAASQWTDVTIVGTYTDNYRVGFKVLASNDPTFPTSTSTLLAEKAGGYSGNIDERKLVIDDATLLSTPYRYLRVITTSSGHRFGVSEIDITGYEPTLPTTDGLVELTQRPDVYAKVATEDASTYTAQQVFDGDGATGYAVTEATTPELMVDLKRESSIDMIEFTPVAGNAAFRKDYEIHVSNSPTFADYNLVYKNTYKETAEGATVRAYMPENTSGRHVRIKADGAALGVAEFKVWGTESVFTLENMTGPAFVSATSGENAEYTVDGDVSTVWSSAEETTKASITYDLDGAMTAQEKSVLPVTSIMLMPIYDEANEEIRKNFNIYGSLTGDFTTDAELIKAVGETPLSIGQYEIISLDEPKAYKKIKIEKATEPSASESLGFREVKILHNSQDAVVKVESSSPANGATGVTNFVDDPATATNLVEVELNRNIVASSINPTNVVIKDVTDGADTVLTGWAPYEVSGKKFSIDVSTFDSNKTYEIRLTTNVETTAGALSEEYTFSFTTGQILKVTYDPDKVLVNVVMDKFITGNVHSSFGPLDKIIDGNDSNFMITSGAPKIQLDLGNFYDIVAVQIVPRAGDPDNTIPNLNILANDTEFNFAATDIMDKSIATYPTTNVGAQTIVLSKSVNARYLGIYRASTYLGLGEFRAYAYVDKDLVDIGAWKVNNSTETTEFSAAGTYTFSVPVNNLSSSTDLYMTVFAYDENGAMLEKFNNVMPVASGSQTLEASITLDAVDFEKATEITAVIYKSQGDAKMVVDAKTIRKTGAAPQTPAGTPDSVKIEYKATSANERVAVQVLGPDDTGAGSDFDEISDVAFNTELCYSNGTGMLAKNEVATFNFKVANSNDHGEYSIRMTVTKADGTTATYDNYLLHLSQTQINECVADFVENPLSLTMGELIDKWTDELDTGRKYIKMSELPATLATSIPTGFDTMYESLCDLYIADGKMDEIADVADCINAAYVMAMYDEGNTEEVKATLANYAGDINGLYSRKDIETGEEIIDVERFATVYTALKSNITDTASFKTVMQWSVPLSLIQGGTRQDIAYAIENYNAVLDCDLSYAASKNVTVAQAVMEIATTNASEYYGTFGNVFKDAVDAVAKRGSSGSAPSGGSPIVSGGVGTISTKPTTGNDSEKPIDPVTPPVEQEPEEALPFNDIEEIAWAKDYIADLYANGIISGDGDGAFHPERQVSREEFLKMLIEALKIDVASKEATEFDDCDPDAWYYPYVQIASSNKITKGIDRKNFGIGQHITRQDMAVLLSKALAIKNVTAIESEYVFGDEDAISEYAQSDVSKMYSLGLISGFEDGTFAPKAYTTRAQAAVIIGRALEFLGGASK